VVDRTLELYEAAAFGDRAAPALDAPDLTVHH
jgi:hypothetical protein